MTISRRELLILPAALRDIFYTGKLAQKNTDTAHNAISVYFYNLCLNLYPFRQASKIHTLLPGSASENGSSANLSGHFTVNLQFSLKQDSSFLSPLRVYFTI